MPRPVEPVFIAASPNWSVREETGNGQISDLGNHLERDQPHNHPFHALSVFRASDPFDDSLPALEHRDPKPRVSGTAHLIVITPSGHPSFNIAL